MASERGMMALGDLVRLQRGTTYKSPLLGLPGPVLLGLASIHRNGGFRGNSLKTYGGESPAKLLLYPGDQYVSLKDVTQSADLLGSVARVPRHIKVGRLTQDTVKLIFINDVVPREYVYWLLRTPFYREYCSAHRMGTTNLSLSRDDFLAFPVPNPDDQALETVNLLEDLELKIALIQESNATLEAIAQALFKSWFVDFDQVRAKADGCDPEGVSPELIDLFPGEFVESELGAIPKGWQISTLGEHLEVVRGLSYKGSGLTDASDPDGVPMHNLNSVLEGGGYKYPGLKFYTGEFKQKHEIKAGDIIVANTEQGHKHLLIGCPAIVPATEKRSGLFSHHLYRVRPLPHSPLKNHFLFRLLMNPNVREQIIGCSNGTTVNMLKSDGLVMPRFICPPKPLVEAFESIAAPIQSRQEQNVLTIENLASLRDTLLPRLISNEPRLNGGGDA